MFKLIGKNRFNIFRWMNTTFHFPKTQILVLSLRNKCLSLLVKVVLTFFAGWTQDVTLWQRKSQSSIIKSHTHAAYRKLLADNSTTSPYGIHVYVKHRKEISAYLPSNVEWAWFEPMCRFVKEKNAYIVIQYRKRKKATSKVTTQSTYPETLVVPRAFL